MSVGHGGATGEQAVPVEAAPAVLTPYDDVAYLSATVPRVDPDRLAAIARLHGLDAPPVATARVLEVGGGDGLNLTAFAAAFPDSDCLSFDLAPTVVARGRELAAAAGVANIRIEQLDILDAAETLHGEYDYILVHGVYAWVPAPVREAIMRLIGRILAPDGIAVVSYNALPGQVLSQSLRAMIVAMLPEELAGMERVDRAIQLLEAYADAGSDDDAALVTALRKRARVLAGRPRALLAHDEFGACFEPQTFTAVCEAAEAAGLTYLNDSVYLAWEHGFPGVEIDEAALRRSIQIHDHEVACTFRHSMFVRAGRPIRRVFDPVLAHGLMLASNAVSQGGGKFAHENESFEVKDQRLEAVLREAARRYPDQLPVAGLTDDHIVTLTRLFLGRGVRLETVAASAGGVVPRPAIGALVRALVERGDDQVAGLDRTMTQVSADFRRLLLLLDGSRDAAALAAAVGFGEAEAAAFIGMVAQRGLLAR